MKIILVSILFVGSQAYSQRVVEVNHNYLLAQGIGLEKLNESVDDSDQGLIDSSNKELEVEDTMSQKANFPQVIGTVKYRYTCVLNSDTRLISAVEQPDGSLGIVYKKTIEGQSEEKTVALAKNNTDYADRVADRIKSNLENSSFVCTKK